MQLLKETVARERTSQRLIVLDGFGNSAKVAGEEDQLAVRQMDEFFCIEKVLGEVAGVINLTYEAEPFACADGEVRYHAFPDPPPVKKVAKVANEDGEEEEGAGEEAPAEEAAEDKAAAFNPRDYQWTLSDKQPKHLAQIYASCKGNRVQQAKKASSDYAG